mgnify:CR=1 FL=1
MDGNTRICKKCLLREMDEAGFFRICMIILQEFRRKIKRRRRNTSGGFPSVRSVKSCCPACAACAVATWRCGQRLHCGTARGKSGSKRETPHSGSCENNGSLCGVLRISEVGKISWDLFASPLRLSDP